QHRFNPSNRARDRRVVIEAALDDLDAWGRRETGGISHERADSRAGSREISRRLASDLSRCSGDEDCHANLHSLPTIRARSVAREFASHTLFLRGPGGPRDDNLATVIL